MLSLPLFLFFFLIHNESLFLLQIHPEYLNFSLCNFHFYNMEEQKKTIATSTTQKVFHSKIPTGKLNPPNSRFYMTAQPTPIPLKKKPLWNRRHLHHPNNFFSRQFQQQNPAQTNVSPPIVHQYTNPPSNSPNLIFMTAQPTYFQPIRPLLCGVFGNFTLEPSTNINCYNMTAKISVNNVASLPPLTFPTPNADAGFKTLIHELTKWYKLRKHIISERIHYFSIH